MDISRSFVKQKSPCADGFRWFLRNHGEQPGGYQQVLDSLVHAGRVEDARWLLRQFGPTNAVLQAGNIEADAVVFAGSIEASGSIEIGAVLHVGRSIRSQKSVRAGGAIVAGLDIHAAAITSDEGIQAGGDINVLWGVVAKGSVRCSGDLKTSAIVMCGEELEVGGNARITGDLCVQAAMRFGKGLWVDGSIFSVGDIRIEQGIVCGGPVRCGKHLDAGWGIRSREDLSAVGAIRAGESIWAGGQIRAGDGYGVYAGLNVQRQDWESCARVSARTPPAGLMSGWWAGPSVI